MSKRNEVVTDGLPDDLVDEINESRLRYHALLYMETTDKVNFQELVVIAKNVLTAITPDKECVACKCVKYQSTEEGKKRQNEYCFNGSPYGQALCVLNKSTVCNAKKDMTGSLQELIANPHLNAHRVNTVYLHQQAWNHMERYAKMALDLGHLVVMPAA